MFLWGFWDGRGYYGLAFLVGWLKRAFEDMVEVWQQIALAVLILVVFGSFVKEWLPPEVVAMGALVVACVIGVLPIRAGDNGMTYGALEGFGHAAPITVACMFVLSEALERTGVIGSLAMWFERVAATSRLKLLTVMLVVVAVLSGFMNNTPVVVVFLPIVIAICRRKDWQASKFLIPLSYAAIVGGTMTMIGTSTNLIAGGIAARYSPDLAFSMFDITPLGLIYVVVTFAYLMTVGPKLLPVRSTLAALINTEDTREFITHAYVAADSPLEGKVFTETQLAKGKRARVLEVVRNGLRVDQPLNEIMFREGDEIVLKGELEGLMDLSKEDGIHVGGVESLGLEGVRTESALLMEGIIGPESTMAGKSLKELNFRRRFGVLIVAVHRRGKNLKERFEDVKLAFGDTLLVQGRAEKMRQLFELKDFVNLSQPERREVRRRKAPLAISALVSFMVVGALGGFGLIPEVPIVLMALGGAVFVLATRCLDPADAYGAIEWRVLFIIFGMLGLGNAMQNAGLTAILADWMVAGLDGMSPVLMVAVFYLGAMVLTEMISNNAVAVLLTPLAITVGVQLGVDPKGLIVAVMFGSSASFATPIGYQTNTFVYGAGGYRFGDFFKVGAPLSLILWIVASVMIPVFWPL